MGNSSQTQHKSHQELNSFQMQKYMGQGMNQQQVLKIREAFDSFNPVDGYIDVTNYKARISQSGSRELIQRQLNSKNKINFDQFFAISQKIIQERVRSNPALIIDTSQVQATCLFCPYAEDKVRN